MREARSRALVGLDQRMVCSCRFLQPRPGSSSADILNRTLGQIELSFQRSSALASSKTAFDFAYLSFGQFRLSVPVAARLSSVTYRICCVVEVGAPVEIVGTIVCRDTVAVKGERFVVRRRPMEGPADKPCYVGFSATREMVN